MAVFAAITRKPHSLSRYQIEDATHLRNANWSYAICQDETRKLWIATCLGGLFVVDKQQMLSSGEKPFVAERNYFASGGAQGLSGNMLQFLAMDADRNMWTGTYRDGISKIDRLNQKVTRFTTRTADDHLPSDDVTAMIVDSDNILMDSAKRSHGENGSPQTQYESYFGHPAEW